MHLFSLDDQGQIQRGSREIGAPYLHVVHGAPKSPTSTFSTSEEEEEENKKEEEKEKARREKEEMKVSTFIDRECSQP